MNQTTPLPDPVPVTPGTHPAFARATLGLALLLAACSGGGGGGSGGGDDPTPYRTEFLAMQGEWHVVSSDLVLDDPTAPYVPLGIEDTIVTLEFLDDDPLEGNPDVYYGAYRVEIPMVSTLSPSFGPRMATLAIAQQPTPAVLLQLVGKCYSPSQDVTVVLSPLSPPWSLAADRYEFEVYAGMQLISVQVNEPGVDDDEDGLVDEPGEFALYDEIAPEAVLVTSGQLTLTITR